MSGQQQFNPRRKPARGGNTSNYGGARRQPRNHQDKSNMSEGIYKNEHFMHSTASMIGCTMKVKVKNEKVYEGIFRTLSAKMEVILDKAHLVDGTKLPSKDHILNLMIIPWKDVVIMQALNVDPDFALIGADSFTDSSFSNRYNGRTGEKELQPWDSNSEDCSELESGPLEDALDANANGWDANLMFQTNESKFNIKSKYDPSLKDYTTELQKADTDEYRNREAIAERHAKEIEGNPTYCEVENVDEEMAFSAVHRPEETAASPTSGNGVGVPGKYVVPQLRAGQPLAQRPNQLIVTPSAQTEAVRGQGQPVHAAENAAVGVSASTGMIRLNGEAWKDEIERQQLPAAKVAGPPVTSEILSDKPKISVANVSSGAKPELQKPRADEIQELKEFNKNFKLPDSDSREVKHVASLQQQQQPAPSVPPTALVALAQMQTVQQPPPSQQMPVETSRHGYQERAELEEEHKEDITKKEKSTDCDSALIQML